jgi:hypothetical protein
MMMSEEILAEYAIIAAKAEGHPKTLGSPPFVLRIDKHYFVFSEVESKGRSFHLLLGEAGGVRPTLSLTNSTVSRAASPAASLESSAATDWLKLSQVPFGVAHFSLPIIA